MLHNIFFPILFYTLKYNYSQDVNLKMDSWDQSLRHHKLAQIHSLRQNWSLQLRIWHRSFTSMNSLKTAIVSKEKVFLLPSLINKLVNLVSVSFKLCKQQ